VCKLPDWALSRDQNDSCLHDGLQEWMRPDADFDCNWDQRNAQGTCSDPSTLFFSGAELMKRVTSNPQVRTMLLGHTHYNSLEILETGDELLPGQFPVDDDKAKLLADLEIENPMRGYAVQQRHALLSGLGGDFDSHAIPQQPVIDRVRSFAAFYEKNVPPQAQRVLDAPMGKPRELVVLRLVSNADLANQTYNGKSALGFAVLHISKKDDARAYANPQINGISFFVNDGGNSFSDISTVALDRTKHVAPHDASNPLTPLYVW